MASLPMAAARAHRAIIERLEDEAQSLDVVSITGTLRDRPVSYSEAGEHDVIVDRHHAARSARPRRRTDRPSCRSPECERGD